MTVLESAAAYATIANDGVYIEPTFYSKIETSSGKTVMESEQETRTVFSEETAYIVKSLLTEPVEESYGTATYCSISNIDVAAKTGTTNENYDRWLCGFTPYYTAVTWYGYDINETISYNGRNPAGLIWANIMTSVHSGLEAATFEQPSGVKSAEICSITGELANGYCSETYEEYFLRGTIPSTCTTHSSGNTGEGSTVTIIQEKIQTEQDVEIDETETTTQNTNTSSSSSTNTSSNTTNSSSSGGSTNRNTINQSSSGTNSSQTNTATSSGGGGTTPESSSSGTATTPSTDTTTSQNQSDSDSDESTSDDSEAETDTSIESTE